MNSFEGKIVLVLAGAQGIGRSCSEVLAQRGAKVYLADWQKEIAEKTAQEICDQGFQAKGVFFNAFEKDTYKELIDQIISLEGRIDVLVNNFGGTNPVSDKDLVHTDIEQWEKNILSNINSVFIPSKYVIPYMVKNGGGSIVNISSMASISPDVTSIAYGTAKNAINHLTQQIAIQYARYSIRCNAVLPGLIQTHASEKYLSEEFRSHFLSLQPIQRIGNVEDISYAVAFLASEEAGFITGVLLPVTGGMNLASARYPQDIKKINFEQ